MIVARAAGLAVLSILLAGPVSSALARARWVERTPTAAAVLWQAVCLTSGLTMIEAGLTVALAPLGPSLAQALRVWSVRARSGHPFQGLSGVGILCGGLALMAAAVLLGELIRSLVWAHRRRRAHRMVLDLLTGGRPVRAQVGAGVRVLDHPRAVAYTVPGWHARIVLSAGLVDLLDADEVQAVIGHERAHVALRHDLLVMPFQAWERALGRLPGVRAAGTAVSDLTEMMADDRAARGCSSRTVASALVKVSLAGTPPAPIGSTDRGVPTGCEDPLPSRSVVRRVRRLGCSEVSSPAAAALWVLSACLLAIPVAALVVPW